MALRAESKEHDLKSAPVTAPVAAPVADSRGLAEDDKATKESPPTATDSAVPTETSPVLRVCIVGA